MGGWTLSRRLRRDRGADSEAPGLPGPRSRISHTDSGQSVDLLRRHGGPGFDPQSGCARGRVSIKSAIQFKLACQTSGAGNAGTTAQEHGGRISAFSRDDVQHPMHAVAKIKIPMSRRTEHDLRTCRSAGMGMRGTVLEPVIGLGLHNTQPHDFPRRQASTKHAPQQVTRHRHSIARKTMFF